MRDKGGKKRESKRQRKRANRRGRGVKTEKDIGNHSVENQIGVS